MNFQKGAPFQPFFIVRLRNSHNDACHKLMKSEIFWCPYKCRGGGTSYVRYMGMWRPNGWILHTHTHTHPSKNPETWVKWVEIWVKVMENLYLWKMGIKSEKKARKKSLNKHGFPFSWECVGVLWSSWPHIVKLNEWTSVTAIVNYCPMTCRLCYEYRST